MEATQKYELCYPGESVRSDSRAVISMLIIFLEEDEAETAIVVVGSGKGVPPVTGHTHGHPARCQPCSEREGIWGPD